MSELECLRECGEIHKQLKLNLKDYIKPGMKIIDIVNYIETSINDKIGFVENKHLNCGVGFPTGISINNCAAHWTPEINDKTIINTNTNTDNNIHINKHENPKYKYEYQY